MEKTLSTDDNKGEEKEEEEEEGGNGEMRGEGGSITAQACLKPRTNNIKQESEIVEQLMLGLGERDQNLLNNFFPG